MTESIKISGIDIGSNCPPFIIAEMSGNHNQSLEKALQIVEAAAQSGVHALKIQTYTADTMTIDVNEGEFHIDDNESLWDGNSLYKLYQLAYTPWEWHKPIFDLAAKLGLVGFSTPFDNSAVDFLEDLNVPCYKIASFENNDIPLIKYVASTGKPMIISTGMAKEAELQEAVDAARDAGCKQLILLKCTSTYPANAEFANLATMLDMQRKFGCQIGISDHTLGIGVSIAASALGASVIEKHFTVSRAEGGVDSAFSLEPAEMRSLVEESRKAHYAFGQISYGPTESEKSSIRFRRSLYIVKDMKAGEALTTNNVRCIRPGYGMAPKYLEQILGKKVVVDVPMGTALKWEILGD
jgi:pseudaminic acid synthase